MKTFIRIVLILALLVLMGFLATAYFLHRLKPTLEGELELPSLQAEASVYYDDFGVPHIYASNMHDAYATFGYVHAQDRLFQMELMRRVGQGRLAEVLGPDLVDTDAFFRTLGTHRQAKRDANAFRNLPAQLQEATEAYLEGINDYISEGQRPLEYVLARFHPEPFSVEDLYSIAAYMAYSFSYSLRTDPVIDHIVNKLDSTYLADLDLAYDVAATPRDEASPVALQAPIPFGKRTSRSAAQLIDLLPVPVLQGSNSWALSGERTAGKQPMLANDTHIRYASPSVWYEAHLNYPGYEFYGNYLAGIPLALIGHSRHHGWGITMFEDDDSDFFEQRFAREDSSETIFGESQSRPVNKFREHISVSGGSDTSFTVYETENGPIINAFLPSASDFEGKGHEAPIAMYWNYTCVENNLLESFFRMERATSLSEFEAALPGIASPGLNVVYTDAKGDIATWSCSRLIDRAEHSRGKAFLRGYEPDDAYRGYLAFEHNPKRVNPPEGYIVSANQHPRLADPDAIAYPGYYAPENRYKRIEEMILQGGEASAIDDMMEWITDVRSHAEARVAKELCSIMDGSAGKGEAQGKAVLDLLRSWDGSHQLDDTAPGFYYLWLHHVLEMCMKDELGESLYSSLLGTHLLPRSYANIIANADSPWWLNERDPDAAQGRQAIVEAAFAKALETMERKLGPNTSDWQWGRLHSTEHEHPLGQVDFLRPFFNVGPFAAPGGKETVNNAGFRFNAEAEYKVSYGPAMRILIDFADVESALSILPTGNSGNVMSPHYQDQAEAYIHGGFRPMLMNEGEIRQQGKDRLLKLRSTQD